MQRHFLATGEAEDHGDVTGGDPAIERCLADPQLSGGRCARNGRSNDALQLEAYRLDVFARGQVLLGLTQVNEAVDESLLLEGVHSAKPTPYEGFWQIFSTGKA